MKTAPTAYFRYTTRGTVGWYCEAHKNRLTSPFWAGGDASVRITCCKCGTKMGGEA